MRPPSARSSPTIMKKDVVLPAPFGPRRPTTSPRWMSRLTRSTTRRFLKRLRKPWAIRPSISRTDRPRGAELDLGFGLVVLALVEDGLDPLLLPALHQAPVLGDEDGDAVARDDVGIAPHPRVPDEDHALLGVVVLRALRGPHPAVAGDDPDVARGHYPLHPIRLGVRIDLHLVRVLDGVVLARDHVALEDGQPLPLEAVEAVRVHDDGGVLVIVLGLVAGGRGLGRRSARPRGRRRAAALCPHVGSRGANQEERDEARNDQVLHQLRRPAGSASEREASLPAGRAGRVWGALDSGELELLAAPKVAFTRPRISVTSSEGRVSRPNPVTTPLPL